MPRIFIAIRFCDEFKTKLSDIQDILKARGVKGNYCSWGNLHMTLAFIGELRDTPLPSSHDNGQYAKNGDLTAIRNAVSEVTFTPFDISLGKLGSFPTKRGVIWCGIRDSRKLTDLAEQLREKLTAHGVAFRRQVFFPHISLVQHPSSIVTDIETPDASMRVDRICVMKSERIHDEAGQQEQNKACPEGRLVYSEI